MQGNDDSCQKRICTDKVQTNKHYVDLEEVDASLVED